MQSYLKALCVTLGASEPVKASQEPGTCSVPPEGFRSEAEFDLWVRADLAAIKLEWV